MTPLRVLVCGSVDDGKSTLIGRLLHECGAIPDDQLAGLRHDGALDLSWFTDGLEAEREQGITIDVAHRQFRTSRRRVLLLDCPGHEQYTRNMATAAAGAELAVVLVDAARGVQPQTRRHALIARLMGVQATVFVVNKMDLVGFDQARFTALAATLDGVAPGALVLPACALDGDGLTRPGGRMPWFAGPTLLHHLDTVRIPPAPPGGFRMPVQMVLRDGQRRFYAGTVAAGRVAVNHDVAVSSAPPTRVVAIHGPHGEQDAAEAGEAVAIELSDARDIGRGAVLSAIDDPAPMADQFQAHLVWCDDQPLLPGRPYLFKLGTRTLPGTVSRIRHGIDVDTGLALSATQLHANDVAVVNVSLSAPVAFTPFADGPALGGFIMIDRATAATAAAGMIDFALKRADTLAWHATQVQRSDRARLMGQRPLVVWFTGLSGAGKSSIANRVEALLHAEGRHTALLDGDNLRHGLCRDLGFTAADRVENVRRVGEVAALMADAGLVVLACLISPYQADRDAVRERVAPGEFLEVFVDAPVEECRRRDPKGLYGKADQGAIPNFTGVSAPYEAPAAPDLHLRTDRMTIDEAAAAVLARIEARAAPGA